MEQKIKKGKTTLFPWEAEGGLPAAQKRQKQAEYLRWKFAWIFVGGWFAFLTPDATILAR
jgi:hypothetical protein